MTNTWRDKEPADMTNSELEDLYLEAEGRGDETTMERIEQEGQRRRAAQREARLGGRPAGAKEPTP